MRRGFSAVRRPAWVAAGLALAVCTAWLLRVKSGADIATVLSLTVAVLTLVGGARGLKQSQASSTLARVLADRVARERGRARRQALGMPGSAHPADVDFRAPVRRAEPELVRWRSDGGPERGTLRDVARFYQSLERGRMVILGEAGAGKTVLATELVIDLMEEFLSGGLEPGSRPPVPVWLTLTSVDLGEAESLARVGAEELADRLDQQMAVQIHKAYDLSRPAAERLIQEGWVLPVLDGLDEMDALDELDASGPGRGLVGSRAAAVVRALNAGMRRRPVVLVCRRGQYGQLARSAGARGEDPVLQDARQIVLEPLKVRAICDYLTEHFPGEEPKQLAPRWHKVQATLQASAMVGQDAGLAKVLSSPWNLYLAATAFEDKTSDPDELIRQPVDHVGEYLLGQLIPAVTRRTPSPDGGSYQPDEVRTWLGTLACHLERTSNDPDLRWSPTDLRLEHLWPIGGRKTVRRLTTLALVVFFGTLLAVPGLWWVYVHGHWYPDTRASWIGLIAGLAIIVFTARRFAVASGSDLGRLDLHRPSRASRRRRTAWLATWLAGGLAVGLAGALAFGLAVGLAGGMAAGMAGGMAFGLVVGRSGGMAGNFSLAAKPTTVMRQNLAFAVAAGAAFGLTFGLAAGLAAWLTFGLAFKLTGGLAFGLAFGVAAGVAAGLALALALGLAVWIRYLIGCRLARRKRLLPRRVGQFVDWAYDADLLRMSGTAVQFRHSGLQAWLINQTKDRATPEQEDKIICRSTAEA
jgi:hypothetical protein